MSTTPCTLPLAPLTGIISDGFHETVRELGNGFAESVCQRALAIVLRDRGLHVEESYDLRVEFRGREIGTFEADLVVERLVIVEVKAAARIEDWAAAQILNYLRCCGGGLGVIVNFGRRPEFKRYVWGNPYNSLPRLPKTPIKNIQRWLGEDAHTCAVPSSAGADDTEEPPR